MKAQYLLGGMVAGAIAIATGIPEAQAGCTAGLTFVQNVNRTFTTGAGWSIQLFHDNCSGIFINNAFYTAPGQPARQVLSSGFIAEIHVPYNIDSHRFLDLSTATAGLGGQAVTMTSTECTGGTLVDGGMMCVRDNTNHEIAWKSNTSFKMDEMVEIFQSSQLGFYNYINIWEFHMDGRIEVRLGLTGALHDIATSTSSAITNFGEQVNATSASSKRVGLDHQHNVYYRLDFDIDGAANDVVLRRNVTQFGSPGSPANTPASTEFPAKSCNQNGQCQTVTYAAITSETSQTWSQAGQTTWLVQDKVSLNADGRRRGYEVIPKVTGTWKGKTTSGEPWSGADLFVTRFDGCQQLAVGNPGCGTGTNVSEYIANNENVDGQDVVVWYVERFLHHTRDEDGCGNSGVTGCTDFKMPAEYLGFSIQPRSFSHNSPIP